MNLASFFLSQISKKSIFTKKEIYETIYRNRGKSKDFEWETLH
jgi:hypothetical protein